jgi:hypothetical protein
MRLKLDVGDVVDDELYDDGVEGRPINLANSLLLFHRSSFEVRMACK